MQSILDKLEKSRRTILFVELAALLHDIGKLSRRFIEYRQTWQEQTGGWHKDPHYHEFPENDCPKHFFVTLEGLKIEYPVGTMPDSFKFEKFKDFSIKKCIQRHEIPDKDDLLMLIIKASDSKDSADDRNNPFFSAEQKNGPVFHSTVFGYENSNNTLNVECLRKCRKALYTKLNQHLDSYLNSDDSFAEHNRRDILAAIKEAFSLGLSDTCRPANDTTLWEHCYSVACLAKVLTVHNLFDTDAIKRGFAKNFAFGLLGIGWDGLAFLSYGQKIGDVTQRKANIEDLKSQIKVLVEHTYPVGNTVYEDDNGIYFMTPKDFDSKEGSSYVEICRAIEKETMDHAHKICGGELQPKFHAEPRCVQLTKLYLFRGFDHPR